MVLMHAYVLKGFNYLKSAKKPINGQILTKLKIKI